MICTNKNTFSIENNDNKQDTFNINLVNYLLGPTSKRYNYFSIIQMEGVASLKYDGNKYISNYDIKIKINDINKPIEIKKIGINNGVNVTIFFGYSEEVEFEP